MNLMHTARRLLGRSEQLPMPRARRTCDLVFLFAVADGQWSGVEDLLDSLKTYVDCDYQVLAIDDASQDGTYEKLRERGIWSARNPTKMGLWGLDVTIRRALYNAWMLFDAPIYVKIDPDALLIGPGLLPALENAFAANIRAGIAGTHRLDWDGTERDLSYWRDRMHRVGKDFGKPLRMALDNGYELGDGVQGGCYAIRYECLSRMVELGFLDKWTHPNLVRGRQVAEDSVMTMLTYAAGYTGVDIGGVGQAFALWDRGLPMPVEELVKQARIVTHSIKYEDEESLAARAYFRTLREAFRGDALPGIS